MYVEHNGYVIMHKEDMRFIDEDFDSTEELNEAKVYAERAEAEADLAELNKEFADSFEIINYHKTIWLDRCNLEHTQTTITVGDNEEEEEINE